MTRCWLSIALALCWLVSGAHAETKGHSEDSRAAVSRGALLAASCSSCHSARADLDTGIVRLSELTVAELRATLVEFRTDRRAGTLMNRIAKGYTEAEIEAIASYFGKP